MKGSGGVAQMRGNYNRWQFRMHHVAPEQGHPRPSTRRSRYDDHRWHHIPLRCSCWHQRLMVAGAHSRCWHLMVAMSNSNGSALIAGNQWRHLAVVLDNSGSCMTAAARWQWQRWRSIVVVADGNSGHWHFMMAMEDGDVERGGQWRKHSIAVTMVNGKAAAEDCGYWMEAVMGDGGSSGCSGQ